MSFIFDSLLVILRKLKAGDTVNNRTLVDELEIRDRSAYRNIQSDYRRIPHLV